MRSNLMVLCAAVLTLSHAETRAGVPSDEPARAWRNVLYDPTHYDDEMRAIDAMVNRDTIEPWAHHVRALISRFDAVSHYKAEENMALLIRAIGEQTYPGYPAVDVLTRSWQVDEDRRRHFADWARVLAEWAAGQPIGQEHTMKGETRSLSLILGERTDEKAWLAASLSKTLRSFVETPTERVQRLEAETFVRGVYRAALGRDPSGDDLSFRLRELEMGKRRGELIEEVYGSEEAANRRLYQILERSENE